MVLPQVHTECNHCDGEFLRIQVMRSCNLTTLTQVCCNGLPQTGTTCTTHISSGSSTCFDQQPADRDTCTRAARFIVHVRASKSQKVSVAFRKALVPFLFLRLPVECLEVSPEGEDHENAQPVCSDANCVRISVTLSPGCGPDIGARYIP